MSKTKTSILVECAVLIALGTVLSLVQIPLGIHGGSITAASMLPVILISFRHGPKWGLLSGFIYAIIQMSMGFSNVLYCKTLTAQLGCILLDYVIAFTILGLAGSIGGMVKNKTASVAVGTVCVGLLRYLCSFVSGILLWGEYAPEGTAVWHYSLFYNGSYMIPEIILTVVVAVLMSRLKTPVLNFSKCQ